MQGAVWNGPAICVRQDREPLVPTAPQARAARGRGVLVKS